MYSNHSNPEIEPIPVPILRNISTYDIWEAATPNMSDHMERPVEVGDVISYRSDGYKSVLNFGKILHVNPERGNIRILKANGNRTTIWNIHNTVILARAGNYELITEPYREKLEIE